MCDKCRGCMDRVEKLVRQAAVGLPGTAEEIRNLETTISMKPPAAVLGEQAVVNDLLLNFVQGGGIDQGRVREAMFGHTRNEQGVPVQLNHARLADLLRREAAALEEPATVSSCSSCCKLDSCNWAIPNR
jgi:hypothetical protein